jgi:hypothetical protein
VVATVNLEKRDSVTEETAKTDDTFSDQRLLDDGDESTHLLGEVPTAKM